MDPRSPLELFRTRLLADGAPLDVVGAFEDLYRRFRSRETGTVEWGEVETLGSGDLVPWERVQAAPSVERGSRCLDRLVWIVLNGGLGTSMRMDRAKSLVPVKGSLSFLDLIARYVLRQRERRGTRIPLVFMNSFATREDTLGALQAYPLAGADPSAELPLDFLQQRFPRVREEDGLPFGDPSDREAWAPPGHGNLYLALSSCGLLDRLLALGYRWAFVSNADNLGAAPHAGILGHMVDQGLEFALEVTPRTAADVKGGTLVRRRGRLELLEIAQVPPARVPEFQDPGLFPVFNTNNMWVDLMALRELSAQGGPGLPLIVNRKEVQGVPVVQLETAMGAAVGSFRRSGGVLVSRRRFAPVKTTDDLVVRRSDLYLPGDGSPLEPNPARDAALGPPVVRLDPGFYGSVQDLDLRIPHPLALLRAEALEVRGDVRFGRGVAVSGRVCLEGPMRVEDGAELMG